MKKTNTEPLDPAAIEEIERYKWIESEKAGYDIGTEKATRDWLAQCSISWLKAHQPKRSTAKAIPQSKGRKKT